MPVYKLMYFPARARGELARLLFAAAGQDFEDQRLTFEQWGPVKSSTPYGQMPVLFVDKSQINQSGAICRYLAREFGLYGKNNMESTKCDIIIETANDVFNELARKIWFPADENKKTEAEEAFKTATVPKFLDYLTKILKDNGGKFTVGSELTVADLAVFDVLDKVEANSRFSLGDDMFKGYSDVKNYYNGLKAIPKIQKYLESRPKSDL